MAEKKAMENKKRLLALCLLSVPSLLLAETADEGSCGESVFWQFSTDSVLSIGGDGAMDDYNARIEVPWYSKHTKDIRKIVVEKGVTHIGSYAFADCPATTVELSEGIESIGNYAFRYCHNIRRIELPASLEEIGKFAFDQTDLDTVYIKNGTPPQIGANAFVNSKGINTDIAGTTTDVNDPGFPFIAVPCTAVDTYKEAWPAYTEGIVCAAQNSLPEAVRAETDRHDIRLYDLHGRLIGQEVELDERLQALPKGIYIAGRKKHIVNK